MVDTNIWIIEQGVSKPLTKEFSELPARLFFASLPGPWHGRMHVAAVFYPFTSPSHLPPLPQSPPDFSPSSSTPSHPPPPPWQLPLLASLTPKLLSHLPSLLFLLSPSCGVLPLLLLPLLHLFNPLLALAPLKYGGSWKAGLASPDSSEIF